MVRRKIDGRNEDTIHNKQNPRSDDKPRNNHYSTGNETSAHKQTATTVNPFSSTLEAATPSWLETAVLELDVVLFEAFGGRRGLRFLDRFPFMAGDLSGFSVVVGGRAREVVVAVSRETLVEN